MEKPKEPEENVETKKTIDSDTEINDEKKDEVDSPENSGKEKEISENKPNEIPSASSQIEELKRKVKEIETKPLDQGFKVRDKRQGTETPDDEKNVLEIENKIRELEKQEKKEKIKASAQGLRDEVKEFEKKVQESYRTENYKVRDKRSGNVEPDFEKEILDREAKIRELEEKLKEPEEKEKEAEKRNEKIENLKKEMDKRRKEYLEADYEKKEAFKKIGDFFGNTFKKKQGKNLENDEEIAWYRKFYDNSLVDYKNALIENMKLDNDFDEKKLDQFEKFFNMEAKLNLADVQNQIKIENQGEKLSDFIKNHGKGLIEFYKKLIFSNENSKGNQNEKLSDSQGEDKNSNNPKNSEKLLENETHENKIVTSRKEVTKLFSSKGFNSGDFRVDTMMYISDGNHQAWLDMKDAKFLKSEGNNLTFKKEKGIVDDGAKKRIEDFCRVLGDDAKPKRGETIAKWSGRVFEELKQAV